MTTVTIIQLPNSLANKIAAGEVVERPASVVKELIENSIDAESTWIKIELSEAGLDQIKIIDNGNGMSAADSEKAILRHATSKISVETDLFHLQTLGFRGEALASIASVSRMTLKTSQGDQAGTELTLDGGKLIGRSKSDARKGTEVVVRELFFNTPARLKYMKTIHTELGHITNTINRTAFAHPDVRFDVSHNGKRLFQTAGTGDLLQVFAQVYGMNIAKKMVPIEQNTLDYTVTGYIAKPEITRAGRSYITTIINGRYIRHIGLNQAILRGYHTLLPIRRFPIVVLKIQMDPILVDANVHPTKLEVRFSKERELLEAIEGTIQNTFRSTTLIPEIKTPKDKQIQVKQNELQFDHQERNNDIIHERPIIDQTIKLSNDHEDTPTVPSDVAVPKEERIPAMYPVGQVQGTYIVAQNERGLYLIDQHAAQERIKYEFFKKQLGQVAKETQELLIPITYDFSQQETLFIEKNMQELEKFGLFFQSFGPQTFIIRSHPVWFPKGVEEELIREMITQVMDHDQIDIEEIREEVAILMACKRSIKANHYLNQEDMTQLLADLKETKDPFTCPHGRPIIVHFSSYELEKMFKRVM